jgi:hypothetical protein
LAGRLPFATRVLDRIWIAETTGGPVPNFVKVERKPPADEIVIEGGDLDSRFAFVFGGDF